MPSSENRISTGKGSDVLLPAPEASSGALSIEKFMDHKYFNIFSG